MIVEPAGITGRVTVATHTIRPEWRGLSDVEILRQLRRPDAVSTNHNIMCINGLTVLVAALVWSGVEDQNANIGSPYSPTFLAPMWGAVGVGTVTNTTAPINGSTPAVQADTTLISEVARAVVSAGGSTAAGSATAATVTWLFLIPAPVSNISITEAGIFVGGTATSTPGSGQLLDHAILSAPVAQTTAQIATLSVQIAIGN